MRPGARQSGLPFGLERYNVAYMAFFSAIVLAGTLYSLVHQTHSYNVFLSDPQTALRSASSTASTAAASESSISAVLPSMPTTFLADRRNLLNRIFVKFAWFWTTAAFFAQIATVRNQTAVRADAGKTATDANRTTSEGTSSAVQGKRTLRQKNGTASSSTPSEANVQATVMGAMSISLLRYVVATLLWVFFARWFLGPPLMERVRHYTGAVCTPSHSSGSTTSSVINALLPGTIEPGFCYAGRSLSVKDNPQLFPALLADNASGSASSNAILRPRWKGGHDISGHTYILIVASLYLLEEITPFLPYLLPASLRTHVTGLFPRALWAPNDPFAATTFHSAIIARRNLIAVVGVLTLIAFWSTSLAITAVYFHTPQEKLSGLVVSLAASLLIPKGG